jgi:hypothetical protein
MNTITAADFTVEFDISAEMYDHFCENEYKTKYLNNPETSHYSIARAFKRELRDDVSREIRKSIEQKKAKHGDGYHAMAGPAGKKGHKKKKVANTDDDPNAVRIADITLAFNNHKMIALL